MRTEDLDKVIASGPPKAPDLDTNPGPLAQMIAAAIDEMKGRGEPLTPEQLVVTLAHFIDMLNWKTECDAFDRIVRMRALR